MPANDERVGSLQRHIADGALFVGGFITAASLLLPWIEISGRDRSTIELIGTASALELLEGRGKWLVLVSWVSIPCIVAAGMVAWLVHRRGLAAVLVGSAGAVMLICGVVTRWAVGPLVADGWAVSMVAALVTVVAAVASHRR